MKQICTMYLQMTVYLIRKSHQTLLSVSTRFRRLDFFSFWAKTDSNSIRFSFKRKLGNSIGNSIISRKKSRNYDSSKMNLNFIRKIHLDTTRCLVLLNPSTRLLYPQVRQILLFSLANPYIMMKTVFLLLNLLILDLKFLDLNLLLR